MRTRGFEIVRDEFRKHPEVEITLPRRGSSKAMAYDFFSPIETTIMPNEKQLIFTDVKAYMQDGEALILNVRSSMGKSEIGLSNSQGWIDGDFYNSPNGDGNIGIFLKNNGSEPYNIKVNDRIAQGMFIPFLAADNGNVDEERKGGFGSTGK